MRTASARSGALGSAARYIFTPPPHPAGTLTPYQSRHRFTFTPPPSPRSSIVSSTRDRDLLETWVLKAAVHLVDEEIGAVLYAYAILVEASPHPQVAS